MQVRRDHRLILENFAKLQNACLNNKDDDVFTALTALINLIRTNLNDLGRSDLTSYMADAFKAIDSTNQHAFMICANKMSAVHMNQAFTLLNLIIKALIDKKESASSIFYYLQKTDDNGWMLAMYITLKHKPEALTEYLRLLTDLRHHGLTAKELLTHLQQQNNNNWTMGMNIPAYQKSHEAFAQYLDFLKSLLVQPSQVSHNDILIHFQQQANVGWTLALLTAYYLTSKSCIQYLQFLEDLFKHGVPATDILHHLQQQTKDNVTLAMIIATKHPDAIKVFIHLLIQLAPYVEKNQLLTLLQQKNGNKSYTQKSIVDVLQNQPEEHPASVLMVLRSDIIKLDFKPSGKAKAALFDEIKKIPDVAEQIRILEQAAGIHGKDHPIHKIFSHKRWLKEADGTRGTLKLITDELAVLQKNIPVPAAAEAKPAEVVSNYRDQPWEMQLPSFDAIEIFLMQKRDEIIESLNEQDQAGVTLRQYLYNKAREFPFLILLLLKKDLLPEEDFGRLAGLQAELLSCFMHPNMPENRKIPFLQTAVTPGNPLHVFMSRQEGVLALIQDQLPPPAYQAALNSDARQAVVRYALFPGDQVADDVTAPAAEADASYALRQ